MLSTRTQVQALLLVLYILILTENRMGLDGILSLGRVKWWFTFVFVEFSAHPFLLGSVAWFRLIRGSIVGGELGEVNRCVSLNWSKGYRRVSWWNQMH